MSTESISHIICVQTSMRRMSIDQSNISKKQNATWLASWSCRSQMRNFHKSNPTVQNVYAISVAMLQFLILNWALIRNPHFAHSEWSLNSVHICLQHSTNCLQTQLPRNWSACCPKVARMSMQPLLAPLSSNNWQQAQLRPSIAVS